MISPKTVLVVDDDKDLRAGLLAMLRKRGYCALEAEDGFEARDLITRSKPDLVILDMMMPHWGGLAVLEHFRDQADAPPFIMITADDRPKHKSYAHKLGAVDFFHKPFSMERLLARVAESLDAPTEPAAQAKERIIRCLCHRCKARIRVPVHMLGETGVCPRCQSEFAIVPAAPEDEGPRLVEVY